MVYILNRSLLRALNSIHPYEMTLARTKPYNPNPNVRNLFKEIHDSYNSLKKGYYTDYNTVHTNLKRALENLENRALTDTIEQSIFREDAEKIIRESLKEYDLRCDGFTPILFSAIHLDNSFGRELFIAYDDYYNNKMDRPLELESYSKDDHSRIAKLLNSFTHDEATYEELYGIYSRFYTIFNSLPLLDVSSNLQKPLAGLNYWQHKAKIDKAFHHFDTHLLLSLSSIKN